MLFCRQREVKAMKDKQSLIAVVAKKAAEHALRGDANRTTCMCIYQPKVPEALKRFKNCK